MIASYHPLNCPSQVLDYPSRQRNLKRTRRNPVLAIPPSSIIPHTEESGDLDSKKSSRSDSTLKTINSGGPLLTQATAVGIIGGATVETTLNFMNKLVKWSSKGEEGGLPFVLSSDPALGKELLSYERSSFSFLSGKGEHLQKDPAPIIENIRRKRIFLENSGARCIVMPCHVSHSWYDEIAKGCSVPLLHMGECIAKELKEAKLKPLEAGSPLRIGVVGTNAILTAGFYQEKLQNEGFEVVIPDKATTEHMLVPAVEALGRKDIEGAQNLFRIALQVLLVRAVSAVILASDDMSKLLPPEDPLLKKCIDPINALARFTLKHVQSTENGT